jgi:hypothetical protein
MIWSKVALLHLPHSRTNQAALYSYALQWLVVLPLEVIAASFTISYWNQDIGKAMFATLFLAIIVAINLMTVKGYGEAEFIFSITKVTAVVGFMYDYANPCALTSRLPNLTTMLICLPPVYSGL